MINIKRNMKVINNRILEINPIILCISNIVSINDIVSVCSYVNTIPIVSDDLNDIKSILKKTNALLINIGTINKKQEKMMLRAYKIAKRKNIVIVLDIVGYSISKIRTKIVDKILKDSYDNVIIKGNSTEICKIINNQINVESVNNSNNFDEKYLKNTAKKISTTFNKHVVITGKSDVYAYKKEVFVIKNGHKNMSLISGTGCMIGALIAAFSSITNKQNIYIAVCMALLLFSLAGELAFNENKNKIQKAKNKLLDNLNILMNDVDLLINKGKIFNEK